MKIGDYVRLKAGVIRKICLIEDCIDGSHNYIIDKTYNNRFNQEILCIDNTCIIKSSDKPIGVIDFGDYVNGSRVVDICEQCVWVVETEYDVYTDSAACIRYNNEDIKSIVTKEQFEKIEYKVGD